MSTKGVKSNQPKEEFVPQKSIEAATTFVRDESVPPQDLIDMMSTYFLAFSTFGVAHSSLFVNWIAWFILLSFYINRKSTKQGISSVGITLVIFTLMTLFGYYRLSKGLIPKPN